MSIYKLPLDILFHIVTLSDHIADVLNLSRSCRRFYAAVNTRYKWSVLFRIAEREYGPMNDLLRLLVPNSYDKVPERPPLSLDLLRQIVHIGFVARKWEEIYALRKWRVNGIFRRYLYKHERFKCRRAVYRLWLYAQLHYHSDYPWTRKDDPAVVDKRADFLEQWSAEEIIEMEDLRLLMRDVLRTNLFANSDSYLKERIDVDKEMKYTRNALKFLFSQDGFHEVRGDPSPDIRWTLQSKAFLSRMSAVTDYRVLEPGSIWSRDEYVYDYTTGKASRWFATPNNLYTAYFNPAHWILGGLDAHGDEGANYTLLQNMMKLTPAQIIFLREYAYDKNLFLKYLASLDTWFFCNEETFTDTFDFVMNDIEFPGDEFTLIYQGRKGIATAMPDAQQAQQHRTFRVRDLICECEDHKLLRSKYWYGVKLESRDFGYRPIY